MKAILQTTDDYVKIRQATSLGYIDLPFKNMPGVADLSFPTSKLRRGRVQEGGGVSPTITTTGGLYVFEKII